MKLELIIINQYIYQVRCLTARLSAQKPNRFVKQFCYPSPFFIYFALFWLLITRFVVQLINYYIFFYIRWRYITLKKPCTQFYFGLYIIYTLLKKMFFMCLNNKNITNVLDLEHWFSLHGRVLRRPWSWTKFTWKFVNPDPDWKSLFARPGGTTGSRPVSSEHLSHPTGPKILLHFIFLH